MLTGAHSMKLDRDRGSRNLRLSIREASYEFPRKGEQAVSSVLSVGFKLQ